MCSLVLIEVFATFFCSECAIHRFSHGNHYSIHKKADNKIDSVEENNRLAYLLKPRIVIMSLSRDNGIVAIVGSNTIVSWHRI